LPFSIDFDRRPYNTLALPCECDKYSACRSLVMVVSYFDNMFIGRIKYACDLLLLSGSVCDLQAMVDICCEELEKIDMKLLGPPNSNYV